MLCPLSPLLLSPPLPFSPLLSSPAASPSNTVSATLTNTRQLGVKHVIIITRSSKNGTFGFGLSSRDVFTNEEDHPIYIKSITSNGPAFQDGRLKLGDRLLEVIISFFIVTSSNNNSNIVCLFLCVIINFSVILYP